MNPNRRGSISLPARDFICSTTDSSRVRCISGSENGSMSLNCSCEYRRKHLPGPVRPARPERWLAAAWLIHPSCSHKRSQAFETKTYYQYT